MGSKLIKDCCETKNSSSYLNLSTDVTQVFSTLDDEPITITPASFSKFFSTSKLTLTFATNYIHITGSMPIEIPVCLTFDCSKPSNKLGTDVLFILELSSIISASWLQAIQKSLEASLQSLSDNDRVSIVGYNTKVHKYCGFTAMNYNGKLKIRRVIKELVCEGGSDTPEAVFLALKILGNRIYVNNNTSVVLVSASQDLNQASVLERAQNSLIEYKDIEFSFNAIGLGDHHDSELLNFYSVNGSYLSIPNPSSLDSTFPTLLDSVMNGKFHNLSVSLSASSALPVSFSKIFQYPTTVEYGKTLSIMFLMSTRSEHSEVSDKVQITARLMHRFDYFESSATIDVYGSIWIIEEIEVDEEVMLDFYKEKAVEVLLKSMDLTIESARKMTRGVCSEAKASCIGLSSKLERFVEEVQGLLNEMQDRDWSLRTKGLVLAFIRKYWGKRITCGE